MLSPKKVDIAAMHGLKIDLNFFGHVHDVLLKKRPLSSFYHIVHVVDGIFSERVMEPRTPMTSFHRVFVSREAPNSS